MKLTYLLIGMACIVPQLSNANSFELDTKLFCTDTKTIIESLRKSYKELPFIIGKTEDNVNSIMSLWINPTSKTWTILATKEEITCVVGVGKDFQLVDLPSKKSL